MCTPSLTEETKITEKSVYRGATKGTEKNEMMRFLCEPRASVVKGLSVSSVSSGCQEAALTAKLPA